MGIKDVFGRLNLSGMGTRLKGLAGKLPFKKKAAAEPEPVEPQLGLSDQQQLPGEPSVSPEASAATEPAAHAVEPAGAPTEAPAAPSSSVAEERTDPMLQRPAAEAAPAQAAASEGAPTEVLSADTGGQPATGSRLKDFGNRLKGRASELARKVKDALPKDIDDLRKMQPDELFERFRQMTGGRASGLYLRMAAAALATYFLADTTSLMTDSLVPDPPTVPPPVVHHVDENRLKPAEYASIVDRDIFSSTHTIPVPGEGGGVARPTKLPLVLIGTVVLKNALKSIATIEDKSQNMVFPVRIDDVVNNQIQIRKIEHFKVEFINMSTGNLEYVEIVDEQPTMNLQTSRAAPTHGADGITKTDETHVAVDAFVIRDGMNNLNQVLQDARAIPNFENGMPNGYKILQIVPNSLFDKFGIKNNDVITGINGAPMNDPGQALSVLNDLPNARHIDINVTRNGRKMTMSYDIH